MISFIIPAYNCEKYIVECVGNLMNQGLNSYEIIIINDGSTDKTGEICDDLACENQNVRVIHKKNEGQGIARNIGIERASGKYIAFIDADDIPNKKSYGKAIEIAERISCDWIICDWFEFSNHDEINEQYKNIDDCKELDAEYVLKNMALGKARIQSAVWNKLFRADIIKENKIYFKSERTVISEDFLFNCEYSGYSKKTIWVSEVLYNYRKNEDSFCHKYQNNYIQRLIALKDIIDAEFSGKENSSYFYMKLYSFVKTCIIQEVNHKKRKEAVNEIRKICNEEAVIEILSKMNKDYLNRFNYVIYYLTKNKFAIMLWTIYKIKNSR